MHYVVRKENESEYVVIEKPTETIVAKESSLIKAQKQKDKMNSGFGFCGWTPTFFLPK